MCVQTRSVLPDLHTHKVAIVIFLLITLHSVYVCTLYAVLLILAIDNQQLTSTTLMFLITDPKGNCYHDRSEVNFHITMYACSSRHMHVNTYIPCSLIFLRTNIFMDFMVFKAPTKILSLKISYLVSYGTCTTGTPYTCERLQLVPCFKLKLSYAVYIITKLYGPSQGNNIINVPCGSVLAYLDPFTIQYTDRSIITSFIHAFPCV